MAGKHNTHKKDGANLPPALAPLLELPNWAGYRHVQRNGRVQKPPFQVQDSRHYADASNPDTWAEYAAAVAAVQAKEVEGLTFLLDASAPFAAIDLDNCRDAATGKFDDWAQEILKRVKGTYAEVSASGTGLHIWGLTSRSASKAHTNAKLEINNKRVGIELFRHTVKPLIVTKQQIGKAKKLTNIDKHIDWLAQDFIPRHKAVAHPTQKKKGNGLNGSSHAPDFEKLMREGLGEGDPSAVFHTVVGHFHGIGKEADQIEAWFETHLEQHPDSIGSRYHSKGRLRREIDRSLDKFRAQDEARVLPQIEPVAGLQKKRAKASAKTREAEPEPENSGQRLPQLYAQGSTDRGPRKSWRIKWLMPTVGVGLLSGQWGAFKTFVSLDLAMAVAAGDMFAGHYPVKQNAGVLLIAYESSDIRLRLDELARDKYGGKRTPVRWFEDAPPILQKGALDTLIEMAQKADDDLQQEFKLPLGLIIIDTLAAGAGYPEGNSENSAATTQAVMNILRALAQTMDCFVLAVDHFGKNPEAGTRGNSSKEASVDLVLACLGKKGLSGSIENTRLAVRKNRGGRQGLEIDFAAREVEAAERDEDGDSITTLVVDWMRPSSSGSTIRPPVDPWEASCRQENQKGPMLLLRQVLIEVLTEHGNRQAIPPDGPEANMANLELVRQRFYALSVAEGTPEQQRKQKFQQFKRAFDRARQQKLFGIDDIADCTYLWLTQDESEDDDREAEHEQHESAQAFG
jgi:hypothetical protein